jgi:hypothetical protein
MKRLIMFCSSFLLFAAPLSVFAQEEETEEAPPVYIMATYFYCHTGKQEQADVVVKEKFKPVYDAAVADGSITAWGWLAHRVGGKWRRVLYHAAAGIDNLLDASEKIYAATGEATGDDTTFDEACSSHDDYIWESTNTATGETRGDAGFSIYYYCDQQRESRADEIVAESFAPVFDKLVEDGKIASWGWSQHFVGGKIRRLQTMTGDSHKALLAARSEAIDAIFGEDNEAGAEFGSICMNHLDYMWDIQIENP